ncbi:SDR family NAD(P)-dependent oxidoreductase [Pseudolysinimonas sp.]|jgi:NAD(P)-dependent dehydrogenase (short-subunit alcohol dehydrogenase family)|uniref:SDR family NAD(P)-dependent oxidoreductase n=1 Tax=Pseudolysinimonas sp. TaxID=2680009 RepID=UPI0037837B98
MSSLDGKRLLLTGGAGALGRVIARTFADAGADVAILDLDAAGAETVAADVRKLGRVAAAIGVDLTVHDAVQLAVAEAEAQLGGVDILINAAGGGIVAPFHEMTDEQWQSQMARNLDSVFHVTRAVLPGMLRRGEGRILNIASIAAVSGGRLVRNAVAYATAKAGVVGLTKALAIEVAEHGVTVNAIAPGAQATPGRDRDTPERRDALLDQIPTRQLGDPQHLAETLLFLASPAAVNITGVVLPLDGGHSI